MLAKGEIRYLFDKYSGGIKPIVFPFLKFMIIIYIGISLLHSKVDEEKLLITI